MAANNPNIGAIASSLAITTYDLQVVVKGIEDYRGNTTRFLVIGQESPSPSGNDRTSLLLGIMERPGALNEILSVIARAGIDLQFQQQFLRKPELLCGPPYRHWRN